MCSRTIASRFSRWSMCGPYAERPELGALLLRARGQDLELLLARCRGVPRQVGGAHAHGVGARGRGLRPDVDVGAVPDHRTRRVEGAVALHDDNADTGDLVDREAELRRLAGADPARGRVGAWAGLAVGLETCGGVAVDRRREAFAETAKEGRDEVVVAQV